MRKKILTTICLGLMSHLAYANHFSLHAQLGAAWPGLQNNITQTINIDSTIDNRYIFNELSRSKLLGGIGFGYQWNLKQAYAVNVDLTGYTMQSILFSGVNQPLSNSGGDPFATLNYAAYDHSDALMLEPKFILTKKSFEPYFIAGIGVAFNSVNNYVETKTDPTGPAVVTSTPFNNKTTAHFAYEVGAGVQRPLMIKKNNFLIALDYRYMNWGAANLSPFAGEPNNQNLAFGNLTSSSINVGLIWMI